MMYAEPASQRELTDGRARRASRRPLRADGQPLSSVRAAQIAAEPMQPSRAPLPRAGCPSSRHHELPDAIERVRALAEHDDAAERVASYVSLRQAAGESGAAFVRRLVLAWLEEAGR